jgi:hypothetical protein
LRLASHSSPSARLERASRDGYPGPYAVENDPLTTVGRWVKVTGKRGRDSSFLATELSSFGETDRERLKLRGPIGSVDVRGKTPMLNGQALALTDSMAIEDLTGRGLTPHDLRVSQPAILYATGSSDERTWTATP